VDGHGTYFVHEMMERQNEINGWTGKMKEREGGDKFMK
jgi:hypothetical protein